MMKALIVDDEVLILSLLKKQFSAHVLSEIDELFYAYSTVQARGIMAENEIDIVICDIEMPQENGLEFLTWVKVNYPGAVRMILTGFPDFQYAKRAIDIGVFRYLLKPVSFEEISEAIEEACHERIKNGDLPKIAIEAENAASRGDGRTLVADAREYIQTHYREDISRQQFEEVFHVNVDYLNRIFKQDTGYSIMQYTQYYRVLSAERLLTDRRNSITEISKSVGFDNPSYFTKIFKKWTNQSPAEYRKNHG